MFIQVLAVRVIRWLDLGHKLSISPFSSIAARSATSQWKKSLAARCNEEFATRLVELFHYLQLDMPSG
jgi:hypothetical protein